MGTALSLCFTALSFDEPASTSSESALIGATGANVRFGTSGACLVLPIFGFANAGVSLAGITPHMLLDPVALGVTLGLFLGKPLGVFGFVLAAVRLGRAQHPAGASWMQVYGVRRQMIWDSLRRSGVEALVHLG